MKIDTVNDTVPLLSHIQELYNNGKLEIFRDAWMNDVGDAYIQLVGTPDGSRYNIIRECSSEWIVGQELYMQAMALRDERPYRELTEDEESIIDEYDSIASWLEDESNACNWDVIDSVEVC